MKVVIAGSRSITEFDYVDLAIKLSQYEITEVVSGTARGVDQLGEEWAEKNGVPVAKFPADWNNHGKIAGHIRNRKMALYADAVICVWDGQSKGTENMIKEARKAGKKLTLVTTDYIRDFKKRIEEYKV